MAAPLGSEGNYYPDLLTSISKYVKITVLKQLLLDDIAHRYVGKMIDPCARCKEGDIFITGGRKAPEGFCVWAWADIFKDILKTTA